MDFITNLLLTPVAWPTSGLWEKIIAWFAGVGSFAVAIILLTLCLKIVLLPLDFWQKSTGRKMSYQQALMKPELDEINKKYGNNPNVKNQKMAEVYKKYNVSPASSCGGMLVYMLVSSLVFITLFSALGNISRVKINYEYYQLRTEYATVYNLNKESTDYDTTIYNNAEEYAVTVAQNAVAEKYDEIKEGFLSIKNIWRADNWSSVFPNANEFISSTNTNFYIMEDTESEFKGYVVLSTDTTTPYIDLQGKVYGVFDSTDGAVNPTVLTFNGVDYTIVYGQATEDITAKDATIELAKNQFIGDFGIVTKGINDKYEGQWNGYLILVVLAAVVTFLSQYLSTIGVKAKDKKGNEVKGAKPSPIMGIVLAGLMVAFTISYTSAFALYIVLNSILSTVFGILINLTLNALEKKKEKKKTIVADYVIKK